MLALLLFAVSVLQGVVTDVTGTAIPNARVTIDGSSFAATTDSSGRFVLDAPFDQRLALRIEAPGFGGMIYSVADPTQQQRIILARLQFAEEVTVTATRLPARVAESAASTVVVNAEELGSTAAPAVDDALRQVPGFTLFRRSGSRTANPTTQGASLRGIGGSGASRTLVLDDGIPLNDPFGGWVYWGRIPLSALSRVEVLRGGASELYGSAALSGVIQMIRRSDHRALDFELSYGSDETSDAAVYAAAPLGSCSLSTAAELFRTDGYIPVSERERGPVDRPASSRRGSLDFTLARPVGVNGRLFVRGSLFDEARGNGTPLQINDTNTKQLSLGADWNWSNTSASVRGYVTDQLYRQTFSAISADRHTERLNRTQEVPVDAAGISGQLVRSFDRHALIAGFEAREVEGFSDEQILGATVTRSKAGGTQRVSGIYVEDILTPTARLTLTAAARFDSWRNADARRMTDEVSLALPERTESSLSPRLTALYRLNDHLSVTASAYRAFRAPTLNELYRAFRVGNVLTLANEDLRAERLTGAETGTIVSMPRVLLRANLFQMDVERNIANVTLTVTPSLITRERQNLGETRSRGLEIDFQSLLSSRLQLSGGYLFVDANVREFSANRELEGLEVPQVPQHQASLQIRYAGSRFPDVAVQARWVGSQFEDDQNELRLDRYMVFDTLITHDLLPGLQGFLAIENLFNETYEIGRTPVTTLGAPRFIRSGIRWQR